MKLLNIVETLYKQYGIKYEIRDNSIKSGNLKINSNGEIYIKENKAELKLLNDNETLREFSDLEKIALSFVIANLNDKANSVTYACELSKVMLGYTKDSKFLSKFEDILERIEGYSSNPIMGESCKTVINDSKERLKTGKIEEREKHLKRIEVFLEELRYVNNNPFYSFNVIATLDRLAKISKLCKFEKASQIFEEKLDKILEGMQI